MKSIKVVNSLFAALFFIVVFSTAVSFTTQMDVMIPAATLTVVTFIGTWLASKRIVITGSLFATIYRELWTGEVLKRMSMNEVAPWAARIPDYSQFVKDIDNEMQVIHLAVMGVLPNVLINNTTYPLAANLVTVSDVPIALDKLQTEVDIITDDQIYASSVKLLGLTPERHATAINIKKYMKGIHSLAPTGNTGSMPVLVTTGADDGTGRLRCTWEDIQLLKAKLDDLENPTDGNARILVLCTDHENDLTLVDQKFKDQFYNRPDGKVYNQLGFDIYSYQGMPYFAPGTLAKKSFGSVPAGTDRKASVYFNVQRSAKAIGWLKTYLLEAKQNPRQQQNEFACRHNAIILPTETAARGAIVSNNA